MGEEEQKTKKVDRLTKEQEQKGEQKPRKFQTTQNPKAKSGSTREEGKARDSRNLDFDKKL